METSFLTEIDKWTCMFKKEFSKGILKDEPCMANFNFFYEEPYYRIEFTYYGSSQLKIIDKLLPKYKNSQIIKLENEFMQVEVIKHEVHRIDSLKLVWIHFNTVFLFS